ncbi:CDC27 family protein [Campylobacter gastrosuis]|uniref:CDC27 family protein n=1 Tax=Campylobacter gastrosuis TaxID=2974576 RepID=A0ABT7HNM8_9BACT|nr:CDC27 family protein [Campylobacter gastrosuis]MDL0088390.1 CDC27 family protein [Campylobacter gastrosuis]
MLDFKEVKALEERYNDYILRTQKKPKLELKFNPKWLKYAVVTFGFLVIILTLIFSKLAPKEEQKEQKIEIKQESRSEVAKQKYENEQEQNELANKIVKKIEEKIAVEANVSEILNDKPSEKKATIPQGWLRLNEIEPQTDYVSSEIKTKEQRQIITPPQDEMINFEPEKISQTPKQKPKVQIEVTQGEVSHTDELIAKFEKSKNISYALELARLFFDNGDYENTIKWALSANEINSDNEESWVIFAKAKYKLNQKNDALRVLKAYNKSKNSKVISNLIKQIQDGTL